MATESSFTFCAALIDALASQGVTHAAVSPGSRNTPLLLALAAHGGIELSVHHDERSGGFFALGMAKATGRPTLLCCTSGTAATEYLPALTEARMSHTPLIVLTADRPPELQDRGAPQTIDQTNLYGVAAKWFHDTGVPDIGAIADAAHLGRQAVLTAVETPAGPVHINVPLREPLLPQVPLAAVVPATATPSLVTAPRLSVDDADIARIGALIAAKRTAIVVGQTNSPGMAGAVDALAGAANAIVIADPQSESRFPHIAEPSLISAADLLVEAGLGAANPPEVVLHFGAIHTSKAVNGWLESMGVELIHIDDGRWHDPLSVATEIVVADPASAAGQLAKIAMAGPEAFTTAWRRADDAAIDALRRGLNPLGEPGIAHTLAEKAPNGAHIVAGSSMPIRLIDSYATRRVGSLRVISNRGANGIDGTIATALGVAAGGKPTYALIGDLTALVDIGSLATVARLGTPLNIIVINNDGGGIFDFLPQADSGHVDPAVYRQLIRTPHGLELSPIAASFGMTTELVETGADLEALIAAPATAPRFIEVRTGSGAAIGARRDAITLVERATI